MRQNVHDVYRNEVLPATQALKEGLTASGIRWLTDNYLKRAFLFIGASSIMPSLGLSVPQALLADVGLSANGFRNSI